MLEHTRVLQFVWKLASVSLKKKRCKCVQSISTWQEFRINKCCFGRIKCVIDWCFHGLVVWQFKRKNNKNNKMFHPPSVTKTFSILAANFYVEEAAPFDLRRHHQAVSCFMGETKSCRTARDINHSLLNTIRLLQLTFTPSTGVICRFHKTIQDGFTIIHHSSHGWLSLQAEIQITHPIIF